MKSTLQRGASVTGSDRSKSRERICAALALLIPFGAFLASPALNAQALSYSGVQTTVPVTGLVIPNGVAVDRVGDVFVADSQLNVIKLAPDGTQTPVGSQLDKPFGAAADAKGNVFIADTFHNRVVKVTPDGTQTTVVDGLNTPTGVAVDSAGNVFIADRNNARVLEISTSGVSSTVGTGLFRPTGVAVDAGGNVFISDFGLNQVIKVPTSGSQSTVGTGLAGPNAVALDPAGNVFVADTNNNRVVEVFPDGNQRVVGFGLAKPTGVAVDAADNVFIADTNNTRVVEVQLKAANFGNVNVCPSGQSSPAPCSKMLTLNYNIAVSGTLGTPAVVTQGAPNLDFKLSASTCTGVLTGGTSCTVDVTFFPGAAGLRLGALNLIDATGNVLLTTYLSGQGMAPAIGFNNGVQTTVADGLVLVNSVAVDAAGNTFVSLENANQVLKISPSGDRTSLGSGLNIPNGLAVDGAGNLFISNAGNNQILRISPDGTQTAVLGGFGARQLTVDGAGNLYIAAVSSRSVQKFSPDGTFTTLVDGLNYPGSVALDAAGNLYIAEENNNRVLKVGPDGTLSTVVSGFQPVGVAVDPGGNLYVVDHSFGRVLKLFPDGSQTTLAAGLSNPSGVAIDGLGNVFVADLGHFRVFKLDFSTPPALTFASTQAGNTSTDSPQSVTIVNTGNLPLSAVAPGIAIGPNFKQVPGSGTPADCTAAFSLAPAASCNLSISFVPQANGNIQSAAMLTDNAWNGAPASQAISLNGTGILAPTVTVSAATGQYSDKVTLTAAVGNIGPTLAGTLQFQVGGANACSAAVAGDGTYTCSYTITLAAGTYSIDAGLTNSSVQGTSTLNVTREDATVTPASTNPATVQVNAPGGTAGPITLNGTVQQAADGSLGDITKAAATVILQPAVAGGATIACPVTNTNGALSATCANVPVDAYTVQWNIGGNYYQAPAANSVLAVFDPLLGFVTGSGSVKDNGVAADFAISVKYLKDGTLSGGISYVEHRATGDVTVSSTSLSSMSLVGTTAIINGRATVNGVAGYTLQLDVTDNGSPGINHDLFGLQLSGGTLNPPISFAPSPITAGNIQTH